VSSNPPSTPPSQPPAPAALVLPLTPEQRAAYQDLYHKTETAIENTIDVGALEALNATQTDVGNVLTKDAMYQLHANTALYTALSDQIKTTNDGLAALKKQIAAISSNISTFATILAAVDKVLTLVPGI
jgi:hypothetical protein